MPLKGGCGPEVIQENIDILISEGKSVEQAVAIANSDFEQRCGKKTKCNDYSSLTMFFAESLRQARNTYGERKMAKSKSKSKSRSKGRSKSLVSKIKGSARTARGGGSANSPTARFARSGGAVMKTNGTHGVSNPVS